MRSLLVSTLAAVLAVAACSPPSISRPPAERRTGQSTDAGGPRAASGATPEATLSPRITPAPGGERAAIAALAGVVRVPASLLSNNGGGILSDGGLGVVSQNGAKLITDNGAGLAGAKARRLSAIAEAPLALAGASVVLLDANDEPVPGSRPTTLDAQGRFVFPEAPLNLAVNVVVRVVRGRDRKPLYLRTIAVPRAEGTEVVVSAASSFATASLLADRQPAKFTAARFDRLVAEIAGGLVEADVERLADLAAMRARVTELEAEVAALRELLEAVKGELARNKAEQDKEIEDLRARVARLEASPSPSPAPTPRPPQVGTLAGDGTPGYLNGRAEAAQFNGPQGFGDGRATEARFDAPHGLALAKDGTLFVADYVNHRVRRISPEGMVSTVAGTGEAAFADGPGAEAKLNGPIGLALAADGTLYVADKNNAVVRKIVGASGASPQVSTLVGRGNGSFAEQPEFFAEPYGVAVAPDGQVWLAVEQHHVVRRIGPDGRTTTIAGSGTAGHKDGKGTEAQFNHPTQLAIAPNGDVLVSDAWNQRIRRITPDGTVTTIAGKGVVGFKDGTPAEAAFDHPGQLAIGPGGELFLADGGNHRVRRLWLP